METSGLSSVLSFLSDYSRAFERGGNLVEKKLLLLDDKADERNTALQVRAGWLIRG